MQKFVSDYEVGCKWPVQSVSLPRQLQQCPVSHLLRTGHLDWFDHSQNHIQYLLINAAYIVTDKYCFISSPSVFHQYMYKTVLNVLT